MAASASYNATPIELPKLDIQIMELHLVGDSPLIVHAWSLKAKRQMLASQTKKAKGAREVRDPQADFEASLYRMGDDAYGFPSVAFKAAAVTAVTSVSGITKIAARQAFHVIGDDSEVPGALKDVMVRQNLVAIEGSAPRLREDMVRVGMGSADLRYRAEFYPWYARVLVRFNSNVLSPEQLLNLFNTAGFAVGVGEWRSERDGHYGLFHVASEKEFASITKAAA